MKNSACNLAKGANTLLLRGVCEQSLSNNIKKTKINTKINVFTNLQCLQWRFLLHVVHYVWSKHSVWDSL